MATVRELQAKFEGTYNGFKSTVQGVKKEIDALPKSAANASKGMNTNFSKMTKGISQQFQNMSLIAEMSFEDIGKAIGNASKKLGDWGKDIQSAGGTVTKVMSPLTAFYGAAAIGGGKRMAANEQLDILMGNVFRTEEAYDNAWDAVNGLTKGTSFMNKDVGQWLAQLVQSNVELGKSEDIMGSILDFSVGSGQLGMEGEIHDIIMKAVRSNGWDQMTLDMLAQRGLNLAGHVANVLGIEVTAAQEMLKDGTISMNESLDYFVDAVQNGSEGAGGFFASMEGSAKKGGETFTGALTNMMAAVSQLGEKMWKQGAWDELKRAMNSLYDFLQELAPALEPAAKAIASMMATAVDWLQKMINAFVNLRPKTQALIASLSVIAAVMGPVIMAFGTFVGVVASALKPIGALFLGISKGLGVLNKKNGLSEVLKKLASRFAFLTGPVGIVISAFTLLMTTSETFRKAFGAMISSIVDFGKQLYQMVKPAIDTVIDSFKAMMATFKGSGGGLDSIGAAFAPLLKVIGALVKALMVGLATAFAIILPVISGAARAIGPLVTAIGKAISVITNLGMAILSVFILDFSKAGKYLKQAGQSFIDVFTNIWDAIKGFLTGFSQTLIGLADGVLPGFSEKLSSAFSTIGTLGKYFLAIVEDGDYMNDWITHLPKSIQEPIQRAGEVFAGLRDNVIQAFDGIKQKASDLSDVFVSTFGNNIAEKLTTTKKIGDRIAQSLADGVSDGIQRVTGAFSNVGQRIVDAIKDGLGTKVGTMISDYFKGTIESFGSIGGTVGTLLPSIMGVGSKLLGLTGPVGLIISIVTTLISTLVKLYKSNEDVRNFIQEAWQGIQDIFASVWSALQPIFDELGKAFVEIGKELGPEFVKTKDVIVDSINELKPTFQELGETFGELFREIGAAYGDFALEISNVFKEIVPLISDVISMLADAFKDILPVIVEVASSIISVWVELQQTVIKAVLEIAKQIIPMLLDAVQTILPMVLNIIKSVLPIAVDLFKSVVDIVMELVKMALPLIMTAVKTIFPMVLDIIKQVLPVVIDIISTVISVIMELAKQVIPIILRVVQQAFPVIQKIIEVAMKVAMIALGALVKIIDNVVVPAIKFILQVVQTVFPVITDVIDGALNIIIGILNFFVSLFKGDWSGMWDAIKQILSSALDIVWSVIKGVFELISLFIKTIFTGISTFFKWVWDGIKKIFITVVTAVFDFVKLWFNNLRDTIANIFNAVWDFISTIWNTIYTFFKDIILSIVDYVRDRFNTMRDRITTVFNGIRDTAKEVWGKIKDNIINPIKEGVQWAIDKFNSFKDNIKEIFTTVRDNVAEWIGEMVQTVKDMPGKMADGLSKMGWHIRDAFTNIGNTMLSVLGKGVNGVIRGINWVLNKLGLPDEWQIDPWTVPVISNGRGGNAASGAISAYAKGTGSHPGGPAILGDGKGNNSGSELVNLPDGKSFLSADKPTLYPDLPKGTSVIPAKVTKQLKDVPMYAFGDKVGQKVGNAASWVGGKIKDGTQWTGDKIKQGADYAKGVALDVWDYVENPEKLLTKALEFLGVKAESMFGAFQEVPVYGFKKVKDGGVEFLKKKIDNMFSSGTGVGLGKGISNVGGWALPIRRAAAQMREKVSNSEVQGILAQIQRESGGNQRIIQHAAVNDINMRNNNPARGLLQYIPQTFSAYKMPGFGNIYDGYHQLLAFFNNTTWRRDLPYGKRGWGPRGARKYADGGIVDFKQLAWIADGGWAESIISHDPAKRLSQRGIWEQTGRELGFIDNKDDKTSEEMISLLMRIADAVETGRDLNLVFQDRATARILEPLISDIQGRKVNDRNVYGR